MARVPITCPECRATAAIVQVGNMFVRQCQPDPEVPPILELDWPDSEPDLALVNREPIARLIETYNELVERIRGFNA